MSLLCLQLKKTNQKKPLTYIILIMLVFLDLQIKQTPMYKKVLSQNKIYPWTIMFRTQVKIRVCKVAYLFFKNKQTSNQQ